MDVLEIPSVVKQCAIAGWMTDDEMQWLFQKATQMTSIVEVGSWQGRSTTALCSGCRGMVYAVDPFVGFGSQTEIDPYPIFLKNMSQFTNCTPIRCLSRYAAGCGNIPSLDLDGCPGDPRIPSQVDMVFIDGEHAYYDVLVDLHCWMPKATKLICGHDRDHPGVEKALKEFFPKVESGWGSIWYVEK